MIADSHLCERCGIYTGSYRHISTYHSSQMSFRYRLCIACRDELDDAVDEFVIPWMARAKELREEATHE